MITPQQRAAIESRAYIPEHLPGYVGAVSGGQAFLLDEFVAYRGRRGWWTLVGYPLGGVFDAAALAQAASRLVEDFRPAGVMLIAPVIPDGLGFQPAGQDDAYYRLELAGLRLSKKLRYTLRRAAGEAVTGRRRGLEREHRCLVDDFLRNRPLDDATRAIFKRLPAYARCPAVEVFEARTHAGELVAFDLADFAAGDYAFYMFNLRSARHNIPGASDLLLAQVIDAALRQGKRYLNLGLGIHPGVVFFKEKWGAQAFQSYAVGRWERPRTGSFQPSEAEDWADLLRQL